MIYKALYNAFLGQAAWDHAKAWICIFLGITFLSIHSVLGQEGQKSKAPIVKEYSLKSPYHTIYTHLEYLQEDDYHPEISAKVFNPEDFSLEEAKKLAIQLKQIYDGEGIFIDLDEIPRTREYLDSASNRNRYYVTSRHPDIYLEKKGNRWFYSNRTAKRIPEIHGRVYPFGTDKLLNILPKMGNKKYLGLHLWQLISILGLVIISVIAHKLATLFFEKLIYQFLISKGKKDLARRYVLPVARPASIFVVLFLMTLFVPVIQLPITTTKWLVLSIRALLPIFGTIIFYRLVNILGVYLAIQAEKTESTLDDQLVPLVRKALRTFVIIVGALVTLSNLNVPIVPLLTGLSIGGLAFALAAQDTIKNFFGSIMIFVDKPFQIGQWISAGEIDGTVEEVGFRSTRVRTFRNSFTYVPNGNLANMIIDNHGLRVYRRFFTQLSITYDTPPDLVQLFVEGLRKIVEDHPETRKDFYEVQLNDLGDFSLKIMFYIFFEVPTWSDELRCRHEILIHVMKLAEELGIRFAFPTQTLHMENFPEKASLTPEYSESTTETRKRMEAFLKKGPSKN